MAKLDMEEVAIVLFTARSIKEAAEKAGVSISTLYRLRKKEEFKTVYNKIKKEAFSDAMQRAQSYCSESLEVLRAVMHNPTALDSSRVSAARTVLDLGLVMFENENIIEKLNELEKKISDD
jgi:benzoyl-CoA reductase/2-hydroxyglutaryl-CoA dehydratase subunit BcrC/BadD/HgdB